MLAAAKHSLAQTEWSGAERSSIQQPVSAIRQTLNLTLPTRIPWRAGKQTQSSANNFPEIITPDKTSATQNPPVLDLFQYEISLQNFLDKIHLDAVPRKQNVPCQNRFFMTKSLRYGRSLLLINFPHIQVRATFNVIAVADTFRRI